MPESRNIRMGKEEDEKRKNAYIRVKKIHIDFHSSSTEQIDHTNLCMPLPKTQNPACIGGFVLM